jgi:uncharacterized protein involved in exopolysaccharide biosynthesis
METDTVELIDLLGVIRKRKVMIVLGTALTAAIALVVSFALPHKYKAYSVLEIGTVRPNGAAIESPVVTKTKMIKAYRKKVMEELGVSPGGFPVLKVRQTKATMVLEVSAVHTDSEIALKAVKGISELVVNDHKGRVEAENTMLDNKLKMLALKIETAKEEKKALLEKLKLIKEEKEFLNSGVSVTGKSVAIAERIDQSELLDRLKFNVQGKELDLRIGLVGKNNYIEVLALEAENIGITKGMYTMTSIIAGPSTSKKPVGTGKKFYALAGALVGLGFFVFLSFLLEHIKGSGGRGAGEGG